MISFIILQALRTQCSDKLAKHQHARPEHAREIKNAHGRRLCGTTWELSKTSKLKKKVKIRRQPVLSLLLCTGRKRLADLQTSVWLSIEFCFSLVLIWDLNQFWREVRIFRDGIHQCLLKLFNESSSAMSFTYILINKFGWDSLKPKSLCKLLSERFGIMQ